MKRLALIPRNPPNPVIAEASRLATQARTWFLKMSIHSSGEEQRRRKMNENKSEMMKKDASTRIFLSKRQAFRGVVFPLWGVPQLGEMMIRKQRDPFFFARA